MDFQNLDFAQVLSQREREVGHTMDQRHSLALCPTVFTSEVNPYLWEKHGLNVLLSHGHKHASCLLHTSKIPCKTKIMQVPCFKVV